jgi:non-homologous end joining protein Ku
MPRALHIVEGMEGRFDPSKIVDRHKKALDELIAAKASAPPAEMVRDAPAKKQTATLIETLRASARAGSKRGKRRSRS